MDAGPRRSHFEAKQFNMSRGPLRLWRKIDGTWPCRSPRLVERVAAGWRYAGHVAGLVESDPSRILARVLPWRGAWWRETVRAVVALASDVARRLDDVFDGCIGAGGTKCSNVFARVHVMTMDCRKPIGSCSQIFLNGGAVFGSCGVT